MNRLDDAIDRVILDCPRCTTKVAVPAVARGSMARCLKCSETFRIPLEDDPGRLDENQADDIAIEVLEQGGDEDDGTVVMESLKDEAHKTEPTSMLEQVDAMVEDDPPDIGDESTPEEVKALRRERHKLLLEVGREAHVQMLSPVFDEFQERIKKINKHARRIRAWLAAVDRTSSDESPLAKRIDMTVDASKAVKQLVHLERDYNHALRVLAEALIRANQHPEICPEQRDQIKAIDADLDVLVPPPPKKKGLLSRFRGG